MRKNFYTIEEEINQDMGLCYNSFNNQFLLLNKDKYSLFQSGEYDRIKVEHENLYQILVDNKFLVPDDYNEKDIALLRRLNLQMNSSCYHVMVNTTLDCNLNCWYCYENKIKGSKLSEKTISSIKKNIQVEYENSRFNTLKLSFFGGEPFMDFESIKNLLEFSDEFCHNADIELIADFTTNATLITEEQIDYLKKYRCHFQITLDGDRTTHNKIKKDKSGKYKDTYLAVLNVLHTIEEKIPRRWIAVRINFDNRTLSKIDEIISDIDFLDRNSCYVILKKVWQVETSVVDKDLLVSAMNKFFEKKFLLDYYIMPKGSVCFAERQREVLFNFDGKVFKCSTISSFDDSNSLGKLNEETGIVEWDEDKMALWFKDLQPQYCKECKWFPVCLGICNKQILAHKNEKICTFDAMNLDMKEYLIYSFKYQLLKQELSN